MRIPKNIATGSVLVLVLLMGKGAWAQDLFNGSESESASPVDNYGSKDEVPKDNDAEGSSSGGKLKLERPLLLTKHTMQLGGQISLDPRIRILKGDVPNTDKTAGGGIFTFSPNLGYFIIDKLELLFNFGLVVPFGPSNGGADVTLGFDVGARYFIDFDIVALYFGGMIGPGWAIPDAPNDPIEDYFNINLMVGVLVPLNRHIGIDLGMRMNTSIRVDNDFPDGWTRTVISFPIGYLGVNGFFNIITGG